MTVFFLFLTRWDMVCWVSQRLESFLLSHSYVRAEGISNLSFLLRRLGEKVKSPDADLSYCMLNDLMGMFMLTFMT